MHGELIETMYDNHQGWDIKSKGENQKSKDNQALADAEMKVCFDRVPNLFFAQNCSLEDATVFEKASGGGEWTMEAMDKLGVYLDLVEVALMKQIFAKATDFFETPTKLEDLKRDLTAALAQISQVSKTTKTITNKIIAPTLSIAQRKRKLKNNMAVSFSSFIIDYKDYFCACVCDTNI